jgi:hypothetical protein
MNLIYQNNSHDEEDFPMAMNKYIKQPSSSGLLGRVAAGVIMVIITPLAMLWGINTLFPVLHIPYTFSTWVAMIVVRSIFTGDPSIKVGNPD